MVGTPSSALVNRPLPVLIRDWWVVLGVVRQRPVEDDVVRGRIDEQPEELGVVARDLVVRVVDPVELVGPAVHDQRAALGLHVAQRADDGRRLGQRDGLRHAAVENADRVAVLGDDRDRERHALGGEGVGDRPAVRPGPRRGRRPRCARAPGDARAGSGRAHRTTGRRRRGSGCSREMYDIGISPM